MRKTALAVLFLALTGCGGNILGPSGPPPDLYTLKAPADIASAGPPVTWQLIVNEPNAGLDINSTRIAIAQAPARIDYYTGVAWADRPPAVVQELLLQSFDKSGRIQAVQRQGGGLRGDFILTSDLQDFQIETISASPQAHVRVTARLIRTRDRAIVASRTFEAATPASGDFGNAIAALDGGLRQVLPQIVNWALEQGSRNP